VSGHGIDVCECGEVVRQCRCMGPHTPRVVCKTCPKCIKAEHEARTSRSEDITSRIEVPVGTGKG